MTKFNLDIFGITIDRSIYVQDSNRGYAIVSGLFPLEFANNIYKHPISNKIRVAGHCIPQNPKDHITNIDKHTGKEVLPIKTLDEWKRFEFDSDIYNRLLSKYIFSDDISNCEQCITLYHIDSELALYIFLTEYQKFMEER